MPPPAPEVIRTDDRVHVTMTAARLDAYLSDLPALLASGDAVPHERGSDAGSRAIDGFEMTAVTAGSLLDSVGIRPGDIVADVNGAPLREVASLSLLLTDLRVAKHATLGLRRGEAKAMKVYDLKLDGPAPFVRLAAFDPSTGDQEVKNGDDLILPVVANLAAELRQWVADTGKQPADPVFAVPTLRTFKKDMKRAGVPYKDARGKTADFHSLRRSTGTMLAVANVPAKEAQSYMRHSDIRLTLQVYADAGVVGMGNALNAMSKVPA